jgi:hypothetical protein
MSVSVTKSGFNVREKLKQLQKPIGLKGSELMRAETVQEARNVAGVSNGRKNILYNGDFKIAQRNSGTVSGTSNTGYVTVDRWFVYNSAGGSNISHGRDADVPNEGFSYSYKYNVTTAAPNSNNNYLMLRQYIEVLDVKHLAFGTPKAKSLTMSFWIKSNHSGTITWNQMIQNGSTQRQISRQVQVIGDSAWHKYEMTIPGDTAGGAIQSSAAGNAENYAGLYFDLIFWTESNWSSGSELNTTWQNNISGERAVGHVQMLTKLNDYLNITGIQLEVGRNATEFEHRSYTEELALCQRYFYKLGGAATRSIGFAYTPSTAEIAVTTHHPVPMRIDPGVSLRDDNFASITPNYFRFRYEGNNNFVLPSSGVGINVTQMTTEGGSFWFNGMSHGLTKTGEVRTNETNTGESYVAFNSEL